MVNSLEPICRPRATIKPRRQPQQGDRPQRVTLLTFEGQIHNQTRLRHKKSLLQILTTSLVCRYYLNRNTPSLGATDIDFCISCDTVNFNPKPPWTFLNIFIIFLFPPLSLLLFGTADILTESANSLHHQITLDMLKFGEETLLTMWSIQNQSWEQNYSFKRFNGI